DTAHRHIKLAPRAELEAPELAEFLQFDDAGFRQFFSGSPIKRIGRDRFVRNCLYAAGNSGAAQLLPLISGLCSDPDSVVADAARWAAQRLTAT
ncbi:MAG: epoxyqueuosine reductase, partial [Pseudomonadota bacterium]|nr:epoxyqueuosine reductase [Pseudomonadota bacterium]